MHERESRNFFFVLFIFFNVNEGGYMNFLVQEGEVLFVRLPEELDHYQTRTLAEWIDDAIFEGEPDKVVFDFSQTRFMDSSGVGLLAGRYQKMKSVGGEVYMYNVKGHMAKILKQKK